MWGDYEPTWEGVLFLTGKNVYKFVSGVSVVNFDIISSCKFMVVTSLLFVFVVWPEERLHHQHFLDERRSVMAFSVGLDERVALTLEKLDPGKAVELHWRK